MGVRSLKVTARLNNAGSCYEYTIVSVSRIARRYTIQCSLPNTHTMHIELDGGRQASRERGSEEGWRMGGKDGREGGNKGTRGREGGRKGDIEGGRERWEGGGSDDDRQGERVTVEGRGRVAEGNERGRDGSKHGRRDEKRGVRKRGVEGLSEKGGSKGAKEGGKLQGRYPDDSTGQVHNREPGRSRVTI